MNGHQGTQPVTAAFPYWNGRLAPVFDTARRMLVVTASVGGVIRADQQLAEGAPVRRAVQLAEAGIELLVCGAISRTLHELLTARGIIVLPFLAGDLREIVACWVDGRLPGEALVMPGCRRRRGGVRPDGPVPTALTGVGRRRRIAGGGRGYRNRVYPTVTSAGFAGTPMAADPAVQRQGLEQQAGLLKSQLACIEKRLAELASGDNQG